MNFYLAGAKIKNKMKKTMFLIDLQCFTNIRTDQSQI